MAIHPTAMVDPTAELAENVIIGPNTVIGPKVRIGPNTMIDGNAWIYERSVIGENCHLFPGAVIGTPPQDLSYKNEPTRAVIGNNVQIHEYATVHRASGEGNETVVGDHCLLMAYSHLGHNCQLGKNVILANNVHLGGHVHVGDYANIGGSVVVHQFVKIGRFAMMSGFMATRQDIPPFSTTDERLATVRGLNKIGLKRRGVGNESIKRLQEAFRLLWFQPLPQTEAILQIMTKYPDDPYVQELVDFVLTSKRGIRRPKIKHTVSEMLEAECE
jgi:UDP-N-acetylglucosamine acyltransferase